MGAVVHLVARRGSWFWARIPKRSCSGSFRDTPFKSTAGMALGSGWDKVGEVLVLVRLPVRSRAGGSPI
jgi:hypothetical protein